MSGTVQVRGTTQIRDGQSFEVGAHARSAPSGAMRGGIPGNPLGPYADVISRAACEVQALLDDAKCRGLFAPGARARCCASAKARNGACVTGRPLTPTHHVVKERRPLAMIIASRGLESRLGPLRVELRAPEGQPAEVSCEYRIAGPPAVKSGRVRGVDGFQALQLAMERIGAKLRASPEFEAGPLVWLDMDEPGFPLPSSIADMGWHAGTPS